MRPTTRIRVLVVDDSAFARKVVREVLEADRRFDVVGIARDGLDALEKTTELQPDVVTLDLMMPNLDGVGYLRALPGLAVPKMPRVVVVTMSDDSSEVAVTALQAGAVALVHKPTALATDRLFEMGQELREAVASAAAATVNTMRTASALATAVATPDGVRPVATASSIRLVAIGASTGGPQAITSVLAALPADYSVPVVVALHMPVGYTNALAKRLDGACALEVIEAYDGIELVPGRAVIARAGMHLKIRAGNPLRGAVDLVPMNKPHRPSVDVLFETAAEAVGAACIGVVLTGMGDDGTLGAGALHAANAIVLTEAESSCVVYGMPRAVKEAGLSTLQLPLEAMAAELRRRA